MDFAGAVLGCQREIAMPQPHVQHFFDPATHSFSYVVCDPATRRAAVIDPVLDYDAAAGRTRHAGADFPRDGSQFDHLFADGESWRLGGIDARVMHTPGHTPACVTYVIGDAAFVGDTLFMPDYGTARCDFPGGDARTLYRSIQRIFALPPATRVFLCHDYLAPGREAFAHQTTVAAQRRDNIHVRDGIDEGSFVRMRGARDATLSVPALLLPAVQVNMRAGHPPPPEANGVSYLKIPLDTL
jgi:glyoxylase-like metal-dependent hydrolase (beta-lactamase superfamily II)